MAEYVEGLIMESDETSGGSGPPWKGIGLTAILTVVSGTILSRFDLPHGIGNFAEIVGALGLIAGSIIGWVFRGMIKEMSLVRATLGFFVLGVASAIAILIIAGSWVGMGYGTRNRGCLQRRTIHILSRRPVRDSWD
ncbi:hypothetical protein [Paracoccus homiensis]|uniref:hypothetical protein n=1 Tax=Paracoccus homiensis TaxID=364199 RepID=UPI00398CD60F